MENRTYRNVFSELGLSQDVIDRRVQDTFNEIFYGEDRFFFFSPEDDTMGYMEDTGNNDARTEGMSYGMMMCVQTDHKKVWIRASIPGISHGRWQRTEKKMPTVLHRTARNFSRWHCFLHRIAGVTTRGSSTIPRRRVISYIRVFIRGRTAPAARCGTRTICDFTDPSYHLPHFYELFAQWANEEDREFWRQAAAASRAYLQKACHPLTGLSAEYSTFEGEPYSGDQEIFGRHDWYYSDAYRTIANIALDYEWFAKGTEHGKWCEETADHLQTFFEETVGEKDRAVYTIEGEILDMDALHPVAMTAVNAQASLASKGRHALDCVQKFWDTPLRTGERRYYDNCLYLFAMLALSGNYRIW